MLIDSWLGNAVVVEYMGGQLLEESVLVRVGAGDATAEVPQKVKISTFILENYNQFGIEVRPQGTPEPYFLSWAAVLAIAGAEGEPSEPREERSQSSEEAAGAPRNRQELMDRLGSARTPSEIANARADADSWLATHPSDGDVRVARERLEANYDEDVDLEEGSPT